jgi:hypothetical protein
MNQMAYAGPDGAGQPIIEVDGQLRFSLPGQPLFPALGDDTVLQPTLTWLIQADKPGKFDAELGYITGGMSWHADYNLVAPEKGDTGSRRLGEHGQSKWQVIRERENQTHGRGRQ